MASEDEEYLRDHCGKEGQVVKSLSSPSTEEERSTRAMVEVGEDARRVGDRDPNTPAEKNGKSFNSAAQYNLRSRVPHSPPMSFL